MYQNARTKLHNALLRAKNFSAPAVATLGVVAGSAHADAAAIDASGVVGTIGTGLVAVGLIGAAWIGYRYLKKVWNSL